MTEAEWLACADPSPMLAHLRGHASDRKLRLFAVACCRRIWTLIEDAEARRAVVLAEQYADGAATPAQARAAAASARALKQEAARAETAAADDRRAARRAAWQGTEDRDTARSSWMDRSEAEQRAAVRLHAASAVAELLELHESEPRAPRMTVQRWALRVGFLAAAAAAAAVRLQALAQVRQPGVAPPDVAGTLKARGNVAHQARASDQAALVRCLFDNPFRPVAADPAWLAWNDRTVPRLAEAIYEDRRFQDLPVLADALQDAGCADADLLGHLRGPGPHVRGCWVVDMLLGKS